MTLILCPIPPELKHVQNRLLERGQKLSKINRPHEKKLFKSDQFFLGLGGHGKVDFALTTQKILMNYPEIKDVICLGCAGSLTKEVQPFDVVVGSQTIEHDYLDRFNSGGSLPIFAASEGMLGKFTQARVEGCEIHHGGIASGDEDILSAKRALEIHERTKALAVAWEGAGGARACERAGKNYLELRGVTDRCCGEVSQEFTKNLKMVMINATDLILQVL